jgi:hypothetical protein
VTGWRSCKQATAGRPVYLKAQIIRELDRLEVVLEQLKTVEAERTALLKPATGEAASPAAMLTQLKGIVGRILAGVGLPQGPNRRYPGLLHDILRRPPRLAADEWR